MSDIWTKIKSITGFSSDDRFGRDVSLSGDGEIVAIGSPRADTEDSSLPNVGLASVYQLNSTDNSWYQVGSNIYGDSEDDRLGQSVSLSKSGLILAVGAHNSSNKPGQVKVFENLNSNWTLKGSVINGNESLVGHSNEDFGWSIDISDDGNRVAIGDPSYDISNQSNEGSASVYEYEIDGNNWQKIGNTITGLAPNSALGYSVQLSADGSLLGIGSPGFEIESENGLTSIYQYLDGTDEWVKIGGDIYGEANTDESGAALSLVSPDLGTIDGSLIAIGAQKNDGDNLINSGHVRVFKYDLDDDIWTQHGNDIDGTNLGDLSSSDLSLSDDGQYLAVGSIKHDYSGNNDSGQARIFKFDQNTSIWRQSGFDLGGLVDGDQFGSSVSFSSDGKSLAVGANQAGIEGSGDVSIFTYGETTYPTTNVSVDTDTSILRYKYTLKNSATGENVQGVNLWTDDQSINDQINSGTYDLVIEAKTTSSEIQWNLETFDITLNLVDDLFSNWDSANVLFDTSINSATSVEKLSDIYFSANGINNKEGIRVTGALLDKLHGSETINGDGYSEIFTIEDLKFNENLQRGGTVSGQTLAIDIQTNNFDTVLANYQDTDNNGISDNAYIASLSELGYGETKNAVEIDRSNEIYTYQTYSELINHGTTLWTQRKIGTNSKSFLIRDGSTVEAKSWWSNIGNFETEFANLSFSNIDGGQLTYLSVDKLENLSVNGENTVSGYNINGIDSDGTANSWEDTSESFSVDMKVLVNGIAGQEINSESFYSIDGDNFKNNVSISNNQNLVSSNVITYKGDINYDGRVSLMDLAFLNAGKLNADQNSEIASSDIDPNHDGLITVEDIEELERDFMKSIHGVVNHESTWEEKTWLVPQQTDPEKSFLNVGTLDEASTLITYDNSNFIFQENLEASGFMNSVDIDF